MAHLAADGLARPG